MFYNSIESHNMAWLRVFLVVAFAAQIKTEDYLKDFEFSDPDEVMIAQESRQYQTVVKPPVRIVKPTGVTNSHRPQYNLDSLEDRSDVFEEFDSSPRRSLVKNYKSSHKIRAKETMIKDAVLKAFEKKDHVGKFAQMLPIVRAMSGNQRVALASLVASQVTTPPGRAPLNLAQVRSMFGNSDNTTDLMLPILLDMANLIRRSVRSGKEPREVRQPYPPQMLRRSFTEDTELDDEPFDIEPMQHFRIQRTRTNLTNTADNVDTILKTNNKPDNKDNRNTTFVSSTSTTEPTTLTSRSRPTLAKLDNSTLDLTAESTNQTLAQDLPVAEKLRALSRYTDRKANQFRRGVYPPKPVSAVTRRTTPEPATPVTRRRPTPARKLPISAADPNKCELFTNTLCLHSDDYPTEAIVQSIRRNKAAAAALLADYRDPGDGAVDGVTAAQEAKYNEQHYLVSNRRGDTANRDFAGAGEAGFMCPSTVKYARPQRARATSGQWKYIVNTGEHTQTLRLEKCLKPKESCTYLTDNFKSKCVQVYNYHRLLTWDQQNGLHMDIFKVPTCCSCHIEGYSVSFPPLGHRFQETSSEHFPGEDLSSETGNHALEAVQSTIQKPKIKSPPFTHKKPLESFSPFSDNQNLISGSPFSKHKDIEDSVPPNPIDSYGNTYFPDSFNQASSIRQFKRPPSARNPTSQNFDEVTLPSYLEPPTPSAGQTFNFINDNSPKFKLPGSQFKRTTRPSPPGRRPIRKKISGAPDDLISSGSQALESFPTSNEDTLENVNDFVEPDIGQVTAVDNPKQKVTIAPKLLSLTTEKSSTPPTQNEKSRDIVKQQFSSNGKRVNYNYHPIIDFFDEEKEIETEEAIDREDSEPSYIPTVVESEWKPINHPPGRNNQPNTVGRKKT